MKAAKNPKPPERPREIVTSSTAIGNLVHGIRTTLKIGQDDLARRAGVGRHWIGALEQGKPSLELQMVLRTLDALGLEVALIPHDPLPPWILAARSEAERRDREARARRRRTRASRRERHRLDRLAQNAPKRWADVD